MQWTSRCGSVTAEVETHGGVRAVCYCCSCRDFALRTGAEDALDEAGGSDLYQVAPEAVRFLAGAEHLTWLRLSEKGPLRWYTTCCNTPVANTLGSRAIPFVTLQTHRLSEPSQLPDVSVRVFRRDATARAPEGGKGATALYLNFAKRALRSWVTGGWRHNPFFDQEGNPIAPRDVSASSSG